MKFASVQPTLDLILLRMTSHNSCKIVQQLIFPLLVLLNKVFRKLIVCNLEVKYQLKLTIRTVRLASNLFFQLSIHIIHLMYISMSQLIPRLFNQLVILIKQIELLVIYFKIGLDHFNLRSIVQLVYFPMFIECTKQLPQYPSLNCKLKIPINSIQISKRTIKFKQIRL